nr:hypothetical protein CFP56_36289 [Quercus suber]
MSRSKSCEWRSISAPQPLSMHARHLDGAAATNERRQCVRIWSGAWRADSAALSFVRASDRSFDLEPAVGVLHTWPGARAGSLATGAGPRIGRQTFSIGLLELDHVRRVVVAQRLPVRWCAQSAFCSPPATRRNPHHARSLYPNARRPLPWSRLDGARPQATTIICPDARSCITIARPQPFLSARNSTSIGLVAAAYHTAALPFLQHMSPL